MTPSSSIEIITFNFWSLLTHIPYFNANRQLTTILASLSGCIRVRDGPSLDRNDGRILKMAQSTATARQPDQMLLCGAPQGLLEAAPHSALLAHPSIDPHRQHPERLSHKLCGAPQYPIPKRLSTSPILEAERTWLSKSLLISRASRASMPTRTLCFEGEPPPLLSASTGTRPSADLPDYEYKIR